MARKRKIFRVRKLRRDREWTCDDVARRVGLSPAMISLIESGERKPSLDKARALAEVFGVSIEELFDQIEVPA